jgi:tRNA dimethylallyltransferase
MAPIHCVVVLGPTASGKTRLGVRLAHALQGEVISADSRQVYRGLDIGTGKDLEEYVVAGAAIPYHLIDVVGLESEFNVFHFQRRCFAAVEDIQARGKTPIIVGGTGMYLDAVLEGYALVEAPEDLQLRAQLEELDERALAERLQALRPHLHNTTDLENRPRLIRAIEVAEAQAAAGAPTPPELRPLILGTQWPREELRQRIALRLKQRLEAGLVEEVARLHDEGYAWERLDLLGLEYRFVTQFLQGAIKSRNDLFQKLNAAIAQFAKRQETWFRRMERRGHLIHGIPRADETEALRVVREQGWPIQ